MSTERIESFRPNLTPKNLVRVGLGALTLGGAALAGAHAVLNSNPEPAEVFDVSSRPDLLPLLDGYEASSERREILEPLSTEIAGEIRNREGSLRGYFAEVKNPNNSAADWWVQSTEYDNQGNIVAVKNFGPCRPPIGDPALDPDTYGDLWSYWGGTVMVPAGGSVYLEVPLISGSQAKLKAFTGNNCNREFWGLKETSDINLLDQNFDGRYLRLSFKANDTARRGIVQTQIIFLKDGQVVDIMYSNTSEVNPMLPGEESRLTFDLSDAAPYDSFEVHFLPLQKDL